MFRAGGRSATLFSQRDEGMDLCLAMALLDEAPRWRTKSFFRGLTALNVRLADTT
jgi:hypothetical protein